MRRSVAFGSDGVTLRGWLYEPASWEGPRPAVVMIHGFSATIDGMVADRYAEAFADAGVAALLVDTRGFGRSDGEPRCEINHWAEARDYMAGLDYIEQVDAIDVNSIAVWGDSMSGAVASVVASVDARVSAVVVQVPAFGDELEPPDRDGARFDAIRTTLVEGALDAFESTVIGPRPVVSPDQLNSPSFLKPLTAFHWFMSYGARFGTGWENRARVLDLATPAPFSPQTCVPQIDVPFLLVVARDDEMPGCDDAIARQVHATARGVREIVDVDGGHFGLLYHDTEHFRVSSHAQQDFLARHLLN